MLSQTIQFLSRSPRWLSLTGLPQVSPPSVERLVTTRAVDAARLGQGQRGDEPDVVLGVVGHGRRRWRGRWARRRVHLVMPGNRPLVQWRRCWSRWRSRSRTRRRRRCGRPGRRHDRRAIREVSGSTSVWWLVVVDAAQVACVNGSLLIADVAAFAPVTPDHQRQRATHNQQTPQSHSQLPLPSFVTPLHPDWSAS